MGKKKHLLLLTDYFPFDNREPYVKNEIPYLSEAFESVQIFCNYENSGEVIYSLPKNTSAHLINTSLTFFDKIKSFSWLFSKIAWSEILFARRAYRLPFRFSIIKTILIQLQVATKTYNKLRSFINKKGWGNEELLIYSYWTDARALAIAWMTKQKNITSISRAHGWDVYFERHADNFLPFRKYLHDHLAAIYFVSENGRNYSLKKIPRTTKDKFRVAFLGTHFQSRNPDLGGNELVIVTCASLIALKRIHLVAKVLEQLKETPVRWIHFGDGPLKNDLLKQVETIMNSNLLIHFEFRGDVANEVLMDFYKTNHVDLFVLTSEYEGLPLAIMEALSFGIPVMATDVGGIGEIINDKNGCLLDKDFDPSIAGRFIADYHSLSKQEKQNYRDTAFETWLQKLNAEKNYLEFTNEINQL